MVIVTKETAAQSDASAGIRSIAFADEPGNEQNTSDVADMESSQAAFEVIGAEGEIIIISDADCGMVDIYDLTGRMIATADVKGGETKVRVQTGVYIVAGQKVMVR